MVRWKKTWVLWLVIAAQGSSHAMGQPEQPPHADQPSEAGEAPARAEEGSATNDPLQRVPAEKLASAMGYYWRNTSGLDRVVDFLSVEGSIQNAVVSKRASELAQQYRRFFEGSLEIALSEIRERDEASFQSLLESKEEIRLEEFEIEPTREQAQFFLDAVQDEINAQSLGADLSLLLALKPEYRESPILEFDAGFYHTETAIRIERPAPAKGKGGLGSQSIGEKLSPPISLLIPDSWVSADLPAAGLSPSMVFVGTSYVGFGSAQLRIVALPLGGVEMLNMRDDDAALAYVEMVAREVYNNPSIRNPTPKTFVDRASLAGETWFTFETMQDLHENGIDRRAILRYHCRAVDSWFVMAVTVINTFSDPGMPRLNPTEIYELREPYDPVFEAILESITVNDQADPQAAP